MLKPRNKKLSILYKDFEVTNKNKIKLIDRKELRKGKKISIVSDTMFKTMFFTKKRLKYSAKLISYLVDIDYEALLKEITLDKNELDKEKEFTKGERCDYIAKIKDTRINIELNRNNDIETLERNIEYGFRLYIHESEVGKNYNHKQIIQIHLNNFSFKGLEDTYYINTLRNENFTLTDKIIIFQIFIPNIVKKCYTKENKNLTELERFIMTIADQSVESAKEYALEDKVMNEYIDEAVDACFNNGFGEAYDHELATYNEGRQDGIEEGEKKAIQKTAISFLENGVDINIISKSTGLSIEELKKLTHK